jgi:uncharacterized protein (TIGR02246 family)
MQTLASGAVEMVPSHAIYRGVPAARSLSGRCEPTQHPSLLPRFSLSWKLQDRGMSMVLQTDQSDATTTEVLERLPTTVMSVQEARALVQAFAEATSKQDVEVFLAGFTDDCIVWYPPAPIMHGKRAFRTFLESRQPRKNLVVEKQLRTLNGNVLGVTWNSRWIDPDDGSRHERRGVEFWILRGKQIARWDCATATYPVDRTR